MATYPAGRHLATMDIRAAPAAGDARSARAGDPEANRLSTLERHTYDQPMGQAVLAELG
jgi:hypothetical protein